MPCSHHDRVLCARYCRWRYVSGGTHTWFVSPETSYAVRVAGAGGSSDQPLEVVSFADAEGQAIVPRDGRRLFRPPLRNRPSPGCLPETRASHLLVLLGVYVHAPQG